MPCHTCDYTLRVIINEPHQLEWWCPRCGTLKDNHGEEIPFLVMRCQKLYRIATPEYQSGLHRIGIVESVWPQDKRPTQ